MCIELSPWIIVEDYCATRVIKGTDENQVKNRVAFIEKSGRVRTQSFTDDDTDNKNWKSVCGGSGGSYPKEDEHYGYDTETRRKVDMELVKLGYTINE